jgi:exodeoxyribonuclease X
MILIADTETTGLEPPIGVVEVAYRFYDDDFNLLSKFDTLVNPEMEISAEVTAIHGISNEMVEDAPTMKDVFLPEVPVVLVCHNVGYDRPLLEPYLNIEDEMCTLLLSRRLLSDAPKHQLGVLGAYCDLPQTLLHRAPSDVYLVEKLIEYWLEGLGWTFTELLAYSKQTHIFKSLPFGRHRGVPCEDIPYPYWMWMLDPKQNFDKDCLSTARYYSRRGR